MSTRALTKFVHTVSLAFDGNRAFKTAVSGWRSAVSKLGRKVKALAKRFGSISVRRASSTSNAVMLGQIEGGLFAKMLRTGHSIRAFESATGSKLNTVVRKAFRRLDDVAELNFPDLSVMRRGEYVSRFRDMLVSTGALSRLERLMDASALERLVRRNADLLTRVNKLSSVVSKTKKFLFLGGAITAVGFGVAYVCRVASRHAAENTGCFVYTRDANGVHKCRALGCSCPTSMIDIADAPACHDDDLWSKMRLRESECSAGERIEREAPFCVHCNWDETNPKSLDYVDRSALPDNAFVRCESQDALDALNEIIGGTMDGAWNIGRDVSRVTRDSLSTSLKIVPWILGAIGLVVILAVVAVIWRVVARLRFRPETPAAVTALLRPVDANDAVVWSNAATTYSKKDIFEKSRAIETGES